jgi:hypothetical protein
MVGQLIWCAAHTAYIGTSFMCATSAMLCGKTEEMALKRNQLVSLLKCVGIIFMYVCMYVCMNEYICMVLCTKVVQYVLVLFNQLNI